MSETISGYHNALQLLNPGTASATITGTIKTAGTFTGSSLHGYAAIYGPISAGFTVSNFGLIDDTQETNVAFPTRFFSRIGGYRAARVVCQVYDITRFL